MPSYPLSAVAIDPQTQTVTVLITSPGGAVPGCFADANGVGARANPLTITARTVFYLPSNGPWVISAKVGGIEQAGQTVTLEDAEEYSISIPIALAGVTDANALHLSGNEVAAGNKTLTGTTTITVGPEVFDASGFADPNRPGSNIDPTGTFDTAAGVSAAIADISTNRGGGVLMLPRGTYAVGAGTGYTWLNQAGLPANNVELRGAGEDNTIVRATNVTVSAFRMFGTQNGGLGTAITMLQNAKVSRLTFQHVGTGFGGAVAAAWFDKLYISHLKILNDFARAVIFTPQNNVFEQFNFYADHIQTIGHTTNAGIESWSMADVDGCFIDDCVWEPLAGVGNEYACISFYTLCRNWRIRGFRMLGGIPHAVTGGSQPTATAGILYKQSCPSGRIEDGYIENMWGSGAIIDAGGSGALDNHGFSNGNDDMVITGVTVRGGKAGIQVIGGIGGELSECDVRGTSGAAYNFGTSGPLIGHKISRNVAFDCGTVGGGGVQAAFVIGAPAANVKRSATTMERCQAGNTPGQPVRTRVGFNLDIKAVRVLDGWTIRDNDFSGCPIPYQVTSGALAPNSRLERNVGINPQGVYAGPQPGTTSQPITNGGNSDAWLFLAGGTYTGAVLLNAVPAPSDPIVITQVVGGGSGQTATGTDTVSMCDLVGALTTQASPDSNSIGPIAATDQILVCSLPAPPQPLLDTITGGTNGGLLAGTGYCQTTWFGDAGEGPPSPVSAALPSLTSGCTCRFSPNAGAPGAALAAPAGALGMYVYFVAGAGDNPGQRGRIMILTFGGAGVLQVTSQRIAQLPFQVPATAVAPIGSPAAGSAGQWAPGGIVTLAMTVLTDLGESIPGPTSTVTLGTTDFLQLAAVDLDAAWSNGGSGQMNITKARIYATLFNGAFDGHCGLIAEVRVGINTGTNRLTVPAILCKSPLNNLKPPSVDMSIPPTLNPTDPRGVTAGWRLTDPSVTKRRFWLKNSGGTSWRQDMAPSLGAQPANVNGGIAYPNDTAGAIVPPFLLTSLGTVAVAPLTTSANTTGTAVTPAAPTVGLALPVLCGQSVTVQASAAPVATWMSE